MSPEARERKRERDRKRVRPPYAERCVGAARERKRTRDRERRAETKQKLAALEVLRALLQEGSS